MTVNSPMFDCLLIMCLALLACADDPAALDNHEPGFQVGGGGTGPNSLDMFPDSRAMDESDGSVGSDAHGDAMQTDAFEVRPDDSPTEMSDGIADAGGAADAGQDTADARVAQDSERPLADAQLPWQRPATPLRLDCRAGITRDTGCVWLAQCLASQNCPSSNSQDAMEQTASRCAAGQVRDDEIELLCAIDSCEQFAAISPWCGQFP